MTQPVATEIPVTRVAFQISEIDKSLCLPRDGMLVFNEFQEPLSPWMWVPAVLILDAVIGLTLYLREPEGGVFAAVVSTLIAAAVITSIPNPKVQQEIVVDPQAKSWRVNFYEGKTKLKTHLYNQNDVKRLYIRELTDTEYPTQYQPMVEAKDGQKFPVSWFSPETLSDANLAAVVFASSIGFHV